MINNFRHNFSSEPWVRSLEHIGYLGSRNKSVRYLANIAKSFSKSLVVTYVLSSKIQKYPFYHIYVNNKNSHLKTTKTRLALHTLKVCRIVLIFGVTSKAGYSLTFIKLWLFLHDLPFNFLPIYLLHIDF